MACVTPLSRKANQLKYKNRSLKPVHLHRFSDDYGSGWTALEANGDGHHLTGGHLTKLQALKVIDESSRFRFDDVDILARRLGKLQPPCTFGRIDRHLDYGESISFESDALKGWIARLEGERLSVLVHWHNDWINHPLRDNLPQFWREHCSVNLPLPQTEAEYLGLIAQIKLLT